MSAGPPPVLGVCVCACVLLPHCTVTSQSVEVLHLREMLGLAEPFLSGFRQLLFATRHSAGARRKLCKKRSVFAESEPRVAQRVKLPARFRRTRSYWCMIVLEKRPLAGLSRRNRDTLAGSRKTRDEWRLRSNRGCQTLLRAFCSSSETISSSEFAIRVVREPYKPVLER